MKAAAIIVSLLILQANTSFIDEFAGAMSSVENAISKLLNDVATDVENTIHCTILAMEQVLAVSGAISEPSTDKYYCYDRTDSNDPKDKLPPDNFQRNSSSNNSRSLGTNISHQISSSITNVNNSLIHIIDNGGNESLKNVKKNYTNRLIDVGRLLKKELERISDRFHNYSEFQHNNSDELSIATIWDEMKILHYVERNDKNISEVKEIGEVLSEAVNALHLNKTSDIASDDDKIEVIIHELEHDINNNNTFSNIDQELSQWREEQSKLLNYSSHNLIPEELPRSFDDQVTNTFNENRNKITDFTGKSINEIQEEMLSLEESMAANKENAEIGRRDDTTNSNNTNSVENDSYPLFSGISEEEHVKAVDQAKDIIKENSRTEKMLDMLFAKGQNDGQDVFNDPEHFDFGSYK